MNRSKELTDLDRALLAVIRQCTLIEEAGSDPGEQMRRGGVLVELSRTVVRRIGAQ